MNKLSLPQVFKLHEGRNYAKFCSQAWTQALILKVSQKKAEGPEGGGSSVAPKRPEREDPGKRQGEKNRRVEYESQKGDCSPQVLFSGF